ncbi:hypothetical protein F511_46031 [Dorcoceras hygrometricum]|uniref:Uncharacterized protein n=1 Tax=Dorcoceras hygrometricum TaxID=472368 RepID=A0A2Z6ZUL2_9LAMI|nr:hypothetical protein F511_46031 [Dorcoceras hygrometricum]
MKQSTRGEATSYGDSADGLVLMTSFVTSSYSAGSLYIQTQEKRRRRGRIQQRATVHQQMLLELAIAKRFARFSRKIQQKRKRSSSRLESAGAKQLITYEELRKAGCQLLSSIQNEESDRSLQSKGRKYFYFSEERCTKMERRQDSLLER